MVIDMHAVNVQILTSLLYFDYITRREVLEAAIISTIISYLEPIYTDIIFFRFEISIKHSWPFVTYFDS
jgi:hypothetical protein